MSRFWSPRVHELTPYVPGEQPPGTDWIKLNTNEHPSGPSPRVLQAIRDCADERLRLYPDPGSRRLCEAVARHYGIESEQVFAGNGSDEVLAHVFLAFFCQSRPILFPDITYSFYPAYCALYGIDFERPALDEQWRIRPEDYRSPNGGIIFANPNAPTGVALPREQVRELLRENRDSVVVVDEAYVDFGGESAIPLIGEFDNLLVVQTLSKSRALAGLRAGFAAGQRPLIEGLERVRDSFNSYPLDRIAEAAATAAFEDEAFFRRQCDAVIEARDQLARQLAGLGFEGPESATNFLFVRHPDRDSGELARGLREHGILVRHFPRPERIAGWLRITVGTPEQNRALVEALQTLV